MDEILADLSEQKSPRIPQVSRKTNGFSRADVINAFQSTFEIIGGIDRLSLWANANPDKFYPLYAKLMPSTTQLIGSEGVIEILHRLAPTALDQHQGQSGQQVYEYEDAECRELSSGMSQDPTLDLFTVETTDGASSSRIDEPERQLPPSTI